MVLAVDGLVKVADTIFVLGIVSKVFLSKKGFDGLEVISFQCLVKRGVSLDIFDIDIGTVFDEVFELVVFPEGGCLVQRRFPQRTPCIKTYCIFPEKAPKLAEIPFLYGFVKTLDNGAVGFGRGRSFNPRNSLFDQPFSIFFFKSSPI